MSNPAGKLVMRLPGDVEQEFQLAKSSVSLGRATINDVVIQDMNVSRSHARLDFLQGVPTIFDMESVNGVIVNGVRVKEAALTPGDVISLGNTELRYETSALAKDANVSVINSEADLDATMASESLFMMVNDTRQPRLLLYTQDKMEEFVLLDDATTIGRHSTSQIALTQDRVSRHHAVIERRGDHLFLRDLNSTNGTLVSGVRIEERKLQDGDAIQIGAANLVFKAGFTEDALTVSEDFTFSETMNRKPVIFVPGIMGSELWQGSERVWPNVRVLFRDPEIFRYSEESRLEPRGLVNEVVIVPNLVKMEQYSRMGAYLVEELGYERGKDYYEFGYDWRQDIRKSARKLAEVVDTWGDQRPITIVAHSLGTLVSRYYVECLGGKSKVDRLVLMGGPHSGTPKAVTSLVHGPDILPFGFMGQRLADVMATFVTSYQILPVYPCIVDQDGRKFSPFDDMNWLPEARRPLLQNAYEFRKELGKSSSVPTISVFGYGLDTVRKLTVHREADGTWKSLLFDSGDEGDTSVPQNSAILMGSDLHPIRQYHGSLFVDNDVKMRLKLILTGSY